MDSHTDSDSQNFDVAIIGGGPAGLSAGIWLGRFLHDVVVVDAGDPRNWRAREVHGFLGAANIRPAELRRRGQLACRQYGVTLMETHIDQARVLGKDSFEFVTDQGKKFLSRRVLLATGIRDNWPDIPDLKRCFGISVHTCPNCDGYESRLTETAVIGAGHRAVSVARAMKTWTDHITIYTHGEEPIFSDVEVEALRRMEIGVETSPISGIEEYHRHLRAIELASGRNRPCEHLFLAMGQHPRDRMVDQLGCQTDDHGFVSVDSHHHTSVWNVFAAGDITPGAQMALRAAAGGAEAALSIHHSLIPPERRVHRQC